jgi:hypothetical protein
MRPRSRPGHPFALAGLAAIHMRRDRGDLAVACYDELLARARAPPVTSTHQALAADAVGRRDEALVHARRALDDREPPFILLARHFPDFGSLRQDSRFAAIVGELDALPPLDDEAVV